MIERGLRSVAATWLAGLLVLLPLAVTVAVLAWLFSLLNRLVGPGTLVGSLFAALGDPFSNHPGLAYLVGTAVVLGAIYLLGLLVQLGLKQPLKTLADRTVRRIPVIGGLYNVADRFVGMINQDQQTDIRGMSPVWCLFGGDGAAVLALAPSPQPIDIGGRRYLAVLVPTAPVPFGGALIYVPSEWVRPADIGVDRLTATYVSMGITPPQAAGRAE
jgi:uncharacterized membrane protein